MTLDPSTVISRVDGKPQRVLLGAALPEVIVDGGSGGAVATVPQGSVVTCLVDNSFAPTTSWNNVAGTQAISAGTRRAFKHSDRDSVPVTITFS